MSIYKLCSRCNTNHPIESFYKNSRSKDGRAAWCKPCQSIYGAQWRKKTNYNHHYYRSNKEAIQEYTRNWRADNLELTREYAANYKSNNPDMILFHSAKRRGRESRATPKWLTPDQKQSMIDQYKTARTMSNGEVRYHVDHIVPLRGSNVCGLHVPWNLQILTEEDNLRKRNSTKESF